MLYLSLEHLHFTPNKQHKYTEGFKCDVGSFHDEK